MIPILSDEAKALAVDYWIQKYRAGEEMPDYSNIIAQAQRLADLRWFVGWAEENTYLSIDHRIALDNKDWQELKDILAELEGKRGCQS